jgi:hypothetical protein
MASPTSAASESVSRCRGRSEPLQVSRSAVASPSRRPWSAQSAPTFPGNIHRGHIFSITTTRPHRTGCSTSSCARAISFRGKRTAISNPAHPAASNPTSVSEVAPIQCALGHLGMMRLVPEPGYVSFSAKDGPLPALIRAIRIPPASATSKTTLCPLWSLLISSVEEERTIPSFYTATVLRYINSIMRIVHMDEISRCSKPCQDPILSFIVRHG